MYRWFVTEKVSGNMYLKIKEVSPYHIVEKNEFFDLFVSRF